jgi:hypothetical protein
MSIDDDDRREIEARRRAVQLQQTPRDDWQTVECKVCGTETRAVRTILGIAVDRHLMPNGQPCWKSI